MNLQANLNSIGNQKNSRLRSNVRFLEVSLMLRFDNFQYFSLFPNKFRWITCFNQVNGLHGFSIFVVWTNWLVFDAWNWKTLRFPRNLYIVFSCFLATTSVPLSFSPVMPSFTPNLWKERSAWCDKLLSCVFFNSDFYLFHLGKLHYHNLTSCFLSCLIVIFERVYPN